MNSYFNAGDWLIIGFYLLGIIGLGVWFGKDQHNTRDYFLGSKTVPWWGIGLSIVAAETSALTIIGVPAMAYGGDMAFIQMIIGYVIARIILAVVMVPHYFKGEIYSPYQLLENSFGRGARQTASFFFLVMSSHGAEQLIVQRVLACKNTRDGRRALILSAALIFPLFLIFLTVGVMLWVYYQHFNFAIPLPETRPGIKANDFIYPIFMVTAVPHVLKGFLIVAILSAAMSSVSSALTALASVSTMDVMKNLLRRARDDGFFLRLSKRSTVFWAAALILVAFLTRKNDSVL